MSDRAQVAPRLAIAAWLLLAASVACWPIGGTGIGAFTTAIALVPLLLPLPGIARASVRALRAAPMALAPALALAITEILVNPAGRPLAAASLGIALLSFAAVLAALRRAPGA